MNYFDYLRFTKKEDTKETFEEWLIKVMDYSIEDAKRESDFMYREEEE